MRLEQTLHGRVIVFFRTTQAHEVDASNPVENDMHVEGHTPVISTDERERIAQQIRAALRSFRGDWHLDRRHGLPYHEVIFQKGASTDTVRALYAEAITSVPGVVSITRLTVERAPGRALTPDFAARLADGSTLDSTVQP